MQIILLHPRLTHARSVTLTRRHLIILLLALVLSIVGGAALLSYVAVSRAASMPAPVRDMLGQSVATDAAEQDKYLKENLALMARRLGEMQAQLMRLDALGERVQGLAGVKPTEFNFREKPGQGGMEPSSMDGTSSRDITLSEFQALLDGMGHDLERRADYLNVVESALMSDKIQSRLLPTIQPVNVAYNASTFGRRVDPFSGRISMHEGIDFAAPSGTPILAAAGGVVTTAEFHPQYGNMIEVDHGNDMITRYAHASRLVRNVGDIVRRGQHIADIGTTGRSTGPHLHFEVRIKGVAQDPHKFLLAGASHARKLALVTP